MLAWSVGKEPKGTTLSIRPRKKVHFHIFTSPHGVDERGGRLGRVQTDVSVVVTHPAACLSLFLGSLVSFGFHGN